MAGTFKDSQETPFVVVDFEPVGRRASVPRGVTILDASREAGIGIVSLCGGEGWCAGCQVHLESGRLSAPTLDEQAAFSPAELDAGHRLACQARLLSDAKIYLPDGSLTASQRLQVEGEEQGFQPDPIIHIVDLAILPPSLQDLKSDATRLQDSLAQTGRPPVEIRLPVLQALSAQLRAQNWAARLALRDHALAALLPTASPVLGLAVDIGTTKLAAYLVDLENGDTLAKSGAMNPQIAYGEDVISRLAYANDHPDGRKTLQQAVVGEINHLSREICQAASRFTGQIVQAVVVGNTAMHHLFCGLPVRQLAEAPYVPAASDALELPAESAGLELAPGASIYMLPNIAGYVGADHVAAILATGLWQTNRTEMVIDIGTNTEITLAHQGSLYSCSCASGPAFEGAHIQDGMRAAPGAIERVQIVAGKICTYTIENQPPVGVCGSGILDIVAELCQAGLLNCQGALQEGHPALRRTGKGLEFVLVAASATGHGKDITVSRKDINEIQLAKAAIRTGIDILLEKAGIMAEKVEEIIIAGAFGSYINILSAIRIGMLPPLPLVRFRQVGNAAGMGAKQVLISNEHLKIAEAIGKKAEYIELTVYPDFQKKYLGAMYL